MKSKNFLITGCSTGIGLDCALKLDHMGHQVFANVRTEKDAEMLRQKASLRLIPIIFDVTNGVEIERAARIVNEKVEGEGLHGLVNNAGVVIAGPLEFLPIEDLRKQLEINVVGQLTVIQNFLSLVRKAQGRIINVGSVSGYNAVPFVGPYSTSKFALRAMNDVLRLELKPWKISVSLIQPGPIATPIWDKSVGRAKEMNMNLPEGAESLYGPALKAMLEMVDKTAKRAEPVDLVTKDILHALFSKRPKTHYREGKQARVEAVVAALFPVRLRDRLMAKVMGIPY